MGEGGEDRLEKLAERRERVIGEARKAKKKREQGQWDFLLQENRIRIKH